MLKPYCVKKSKTEQDVVSKHLSACKYTHTRISCQSVCKPPIFDCHRQYLVVHDCSQAHDANMHVVFLAHEAGVLDGSAAGD